MIIEQGKAIIGGHTILVWIGKKLNEFSRYLAKKGELLIEKGEPIVLTNIEATWSNAHSILFTFNTQGTNKYQCFLQSKDYSEKYKLNNEKVELTEEEMFRCVIMNKDLWFKRN